MSLTSRKNESPDDEEYGLECTSIMVGRLASADGEVAVSCNIARIGRMERELEAKYWVKSGRGF